MYKIGRSSNNIDPSNRTEKILEHFTTFSASGYAISQLQLFQGVSEASVATLLANCSVMRVKSGEPVSDMGGAGARLCLVLRGALGSAPAHLQIAMADSTVMKVLPGECVGELSVLDEEANSTTVYALQESDVLVIESDKLWQLIDESNGIARNLLRLLSFRVRAANVQIRRRQKLG